jgi:hypothetical protein
MQLRRSLGFQRDKRQSPLCRVDRGLLFIFAVLLDLAAPVLDLAGVLFPIATPDGPLG